YEWSIAQGTLVVNYNRTNVSHDIAGQFEEIPDLSVENVSGLFDRNADAVERALGGAQGAQLHEIVEDRRVRRFTRVLCPVVISFDEGLQITVDETKMSELAEVKRDEFLLREQIVDERKDIEREIDGQLPRVLKRHCLLISEHVIAHGKARDISAI